MTGRLHVAYVATFVLSPYVGVWFIRNLSAPVGIAVAGGVLFATLLGVAIEAGVYRPLANRAASRRTDQLIPVFIASLGITIAAQNLIQMVFGPRALPFKVLQLQPVRFGSVRTTNLSVTIIVVSVALVLALTVFLRFSTYGKQMRSVRENPALAAVIGVKPQQIRLLVFAIASFMSGVLGQLSTMQAGVQPFMGFDQVFSAFIVAFLAGATRSPLVVGGVGLLVGQVMNGIGGYYYPGEYSSLVLFSILVTIVALKSAPGHASGAGPALARPPSTVGGRLMQEQFELLNQIFFLTILAGSLNLLMGVAGQSSMAHPAIAAVGGYCAALLSIHQGIPWYLRADHRLRRRRSRIRPARPAGAAPDAGLHHPALALRAVPRPVTGQRDLVLRRWAGAVRRGADPSVRQHADQRQGVPPPQRGRCGVDPVRVLATVPVRLRAHVRGLRDDEEATQSLGKNTTVLRLVAFAVSGAFTALAGA